MLFDRMSYILFLNDVEKFELKSLALQAGPNKNSKLDECFNTFFEALLEGFHKN